MSESAEENIVSQLNGDLSDIEILNLYDCLEKERREISKEFEIQQEIERKRLLNALECKLENSMLERFVTDKEYRKELANYPSYMSVEFFELRALTQLEKKIKVKFNIPEDARIRFERVKCCKTCIHNHKYFYAYFWNANSRKLKKKYIGKTLPVISEKLELSFKD